MQKGEGVVMQTKVWALALVILLASGCAVLSENAHQRTSEYISNLPQGASNACSGTGELLEYALSFSSIPYAEISVAASGYLGEQSARTVLNNVADIWSTGVANVSVQGIPFTGTMMVIESTESAYVLYILDSGLYTNVQAVCYFEVIP